VYRCNPLLPLCRPTSRNAPLPRDSFIRYSDRCRNISLGMGQDRRTRELGCRFAGSLAIRFPPLAPTIRCFREFALCQFRFSSKLIRFATLQSTLTAIYTLTLVPEHATLEYLAKRLRLASNSTFQASTLDARLEELASLLTFYSQSLSRYKGLTCRFLRFTRVRFCLSSTSLPDGPTANRPLCFSYRTRLESFS
jgi:hypothetical protein